MKNDFYERAKQVEAPLVSFLQDLIRIPSMSSEEGNVIQRVKEEFERLGYDEIRIDPLGNILGRIGSGPIVIALDAHVDTVDVGDPAQWDRDPFSGDVEDGKVYGRGASDMKGGMASAVYAGAILKEKGLMENVTLYVTGTVQEEDCDGLCWDYIVKEGGLRPDVVVITEPTALKIHRGHRGRMEMELHTAGIACHGSAPERGENAIYKMGPIIQEIEALNARFEAREPLGKGTIAISHIRSNAPSLCAVADGCTIHLDRRMTIGENEKTCVAELLALPSVQNVNGKVEVLTYTTPSYTGLTFPFKKYYPTWEMPEDAPCIRKAVAGHRDTFGTEPEVSFWTFSTNGIATAGLHQIPSVGFGPGYEHFAHAPNERTEVEHLVKAAAFYAGFVEAFAST